MFSTIKSLGVSGIGGYLVSVEVYITNGLPHFEVWWACRMRQSRRHGSACTRR